MNISTFGDLLHAAKEQADPQRLLFVFAQAGVPDDATPNNARDSSPARAAR
jgi:hypothetical protein